MESPPFHDPYIESLDFEDLFIESPAVEHPDIELITIKEWFIETPTVDNLYIVLPLCIDPYFVPKTIENMGFHELDVTKSQTFENLFVNSTGFVNLGNASQTVRNLRKAHPYTVNVCMGNQTHEPDVDPDPDCNHQSVCDFWTGRLPLNVPCLLKLPSVGHHDVQNPSVDPLNVQPRSGILRTVIRSSVSKGTIDDPFVTGFHPEFSDLDSHCLLQWPYIVTQDILHHDVWGPIGHHLYLGRPYESPATRHTDTGFLQNMEGTTNSFRRGLRKKTDEPRYCVVVE